MAKIKIAVVEDEIIIADDICNKLEDLGYEVYEPAGSYSEAISMINDFAPDLLILDIQLSGKKDGIDVGQKARDEYDIPFIFLTSNADKLTVERAKKVGPSAYLVKPFTKEELYSSIEVALYNFSKLDVHENSEIVMKDSLFIKQKNAFVKVLLDDILFIQSDHVYVEIITWDKQKYLVRGSLTEYIDKLDQRFIRVHRGYIANMEHINKVESHQITIEGFNIPIGKSYKDEFMNRVNLG